MAVISMKISEIRDMTSEELTAKVKALKADLLSMRFALATGQMANPRQISSTKKDIARLKTVISQRQAATEEKA